MRKLIFMSLMSLAVVGTSCKKDSDKEPVNENRPVTEQNVSGDWDVQSIEIEASGQVSGNNVEFKAMSKDIDMSCLLERDPNIAEFRGEVELNIQVHREGIKLDDRDEDIMFDQDNDGTWELVDNNSKIRFNLVFMNNGDAMIENIEMKVTKLTSNEMILEGTNRVLINVLSQEVDAEMKMRLTR